MSMKNQTTSQNPVCRERRGRPSSIRTRSSFANAKLTEDRIQNLFDIDHPDHFTDCAQSVSEIDRDVFRREPIAHGVPGPIARLKGTAQAIAMARVDRDCAFRPQVLFGDACKNFTLELRQTFSSRAR